MKNQRTQIRRKNNSRAGEVQCRDRQITIGEPLSRFVRKGAAAAGTTPRSFVIKALREKVAQATDREIHVPLKLRDDLDILALNSGADALKIATMATANYIDFVEAHPEVAQGQPAFRDCSALLGFLPSTEKLFKKLDDICETYSLDVNQVFASAIGVYLEFAREQTGVMADFVRKFPGGIDPEQIAFALSRPNEPERSFFEEMTHFRGMPFDMVVGRSKALLGLIARHPGFEKERAALEMIVEGATRLTS